MSHLEKSDYIPVSTERYFELVIELLDQLPVLLNEIAPNGFEKSIYHQVFYPSLEQAYEAYKYRQMKQYLKLKCKSQIVDSKLFQTKDEFLKTYVPALPNLELEALAVYVAALSDIFSDLSIVHDRHGNCFELHLAFSDFIFLASHVTTAVNSFYSINELFPSYRYTEVDIQAIYRFIFRYLHSQGLDYQYLSYQEKFKTEWQEMSNPYSDLSIEARLEASNGQISTEMVEEMDEISKYIDKHDMMSAMDTPPVVAAYLDVYGHWPEGYL